ncbi:MAG: hypothetical protein IJW75_01010 [Alphaproteobacteria bacterium]|nr:hypothetical protein [Alphaproteobacteria bacterium]
MPHHNENLDNIAIKNPELADKVFNTYEKAMKYGKNNRNSLIYAYGTTIRYAYKNLCDIAKSLC